MKITSANRIYTNKLNNVENQQIKRGNLFSNTMQDTFRTNNFLPVNKPSFTGITRPLDKITINTTQDLISQWQKMKSSVFYEALDDKLFPQNKIIRRENFSYLENLPKKIKEEFVEYFKAETGFPHLKKSSEKIEEEYITQVKNAAAWVSPNVKIVTAGYDPTCSVGLEKAFPGSDLDKAFVVLQNDSVRNSFDVINRFKSHLWFETDQRILSLNNEDTFPEVYTMDGIRYTLKKLDKLFENKFRFSKTSKEHFLNLRQTELEPVRGGQFNTYIAEKLPFEDISKEYAKNFAYFIESVRDGKILLKDEKYYTILQSYIKESPFAQFSNVTQMGAHHRLLSSGQKEIKTKLQMREHLLTDFENMSVDDKFDLIKEIIKSVSKDNENPKFEKYFQNDDNIKERYDRLNRFLLK